MVIIIRIPLDHSENFFYAVLTLYYHQILILPNYQHHNETSSWSTSPKRSEVGTFLYPKIRISLIPLTFHVS